MHELAGDYLQNGKCTSLWQAYTIITFILLLVRQQSIKYTCQNALTSAPASLPALRAHLAAPR